MDQEKVWDGVAEEWARCRTRCVDEAKEFLDGKKGKVLDLGCGSGRNFLAPKGVPPAQMASADADKVGKDLKFYGVDFSEDMLKIAKDVGYVELKKGTTDAIPYGDESFDFVIFIRVLHCVEGEEKRRKSLEEVYRVLKKGGEAVISTIGRGNQRVKNKPKESLLPWTVDGKKFERYNYVYDKDEFEKDLEDVGFEVVSLEEGKNIVGVVRKN